MFLLSTTFSRLLLSGPSCIRENFCTQSGGTKHLSKNHFLKAKFNKNSETTKAMYLKFGDMISLRMKLCTCSFGVATSHGFMLS